MATTFKQSPKQIARAVLADNPQWSNTEVDQLGEEIESLIMLGIAAYTDASNQRPEKLSEACRRLGINLRWITSSHAPVGQDSYFVYFGHQAPLSKFTTEEATIAEIEELQARYPGVSIWVEAVL